MTGDQILLSGLEAWCRVGCSPEERAFPQRLELDLTLFIDLKKAGQTDTMAQTVDYARVVHRVKEFLEPTPFVLVEAVAEKTANFLLKEFGVTAVKVLVKKRVLPGLAWGGVEIYRDGV